MAAAIDTKPRAWVGCLGCYNAGRLVGDWVNGTDADSLTVDALHLAHDVMTSALDVHEELWVMDHEGYGGLLKGECSPAEAQRLAEVLDTVPEHQRDAFAAYVGDGNDPDDFEDAYMGEWGSVEDYASDYIEQSGELERVPEWLAPYIDAERFARDLVLGGDIWTHDAPLSGVWVFRSC